MRQLHVATLLRASEKAEITPRCGPKGGVDSPGGVSTPPLGPQRGVEFSFFTSL